MKKAFTLIELMVTMIISTILINFVFSYQFNFFQEIKYLEAKESFAMNMFKVTELATRGFKDNINYSKGLICLKTYEDNHNIKTQDGNNMNIDSDFIVGKGFLLKIDNLYVKDLVAKTFKVTKVTERQYVNDGSNGPWIYSIEIELSKSPNFLNNSSIPTPSYGSYNRLVYTK